MSADVAHRAEESTRKPVVICLDTVRPLSYTRGVAGSTGQGRVEMTGYVCKRCGGPAPTGVGYAVPDHSAAEASAKLSQCACGYSVNATTVLGKNGTGVVAEHSDTGVYGPYSFRYYLTPCCAADATGVSWGSGIACRACYAELPAAFGGTPDPLTTVYGDGLPYDAWKAAVS